MVQNLLGNLNNTGLNLPPQFQNLFSGGASSGNNEVSYENEHLPKFSEEFDKLLVEYWGKLVYRYSKGVNGGFDVLNKFLKDNFLNHLKQFAERHGLGSNLPIEEIPIYDISIGKRIAKGYELQEAIYKSKLDIMRIMEKIENQTLKTTVEDAKKELSQEYKKGDLMNA